MNRTPIRLALILSAVASLAPAAARADFATTNLQELHGWYFYDPSVGSDMRGGEMNTVTLNHFDDWKYGDNFAFVDMMQGDSRDGTKGLEVMAQPELLVDVLAPAGGPRNKLLVGVEWYLHYHSSNEELGGPSDFISAPQAMIQWNLH